jgi:hypothetical protein
MGGQTFSQSTPSVATQTQATGLSRPRSSAQDRVGNAAVQDRTLGAPGAPVCGPDEVRLPNPVAANGALGYYAARHGDFATRYEGCGLRPPTYYLGYGQKYVTRFTEETSPRLTPEGQAWLVRARVNLQVAIENRREADPADFDRLEKNDAAFTSFAYATHADAYWNAGLGDLSIFDLANIGLTPDTRDLFAFDGLGQVADIGSRLLGTWGESAIDYVAGEGTTAELVDAAYEGFAVVGDGIDEVFGEGTSATLVEHAQELGRDAVDLAQDAHTVASEAVGEGVALVDSYMGEGWTESTVDAGREALSDGADWAEAQVGDAAEWASEVWDDLF